MESKSDNLSQLQIGEPDYEFYHHYPTFWNRGEAVDDRFRHQHRVETVDDQLQHQHRVDFDLSLAC